MGENPSAKLILRKGLGGRIGGLWALRSAERQPAGAFNGQTDFHVGNKVIAFATAGGFAYYLAVVH